MNHQDKIDDYIRTHPHESLMIIVLGLCFAWQSVAIILACIFYLLCRRNKTIARGLMVAAVVIALVGIVYLERYGLMAKFIFHGFTINRIMWKLLLTNHSSAIFSLLYREGILYFSGLVLVMTGVLTSIDLIPRDPHEEAMKAMKKGIHPDTMKELDDKVINKKLKNLRDGQELGTVLGISKYSGECSTVPDKDVNQVVMVLGTTGSGKTITLRRFYQRAITQGYPLIVVDGKPDVDNIAWLMKLAEQQGRQFFGFNCGNQLHYDPLDHGGYTELKDKIICLKDQWENDYYRSIAEDYLQTTFAVMLQAKCPLDLKQVVACLNYKELTLLTHTTQDKQLMKRVEALQQYDRKDITGLQAHLNILIHSELGQFFERDVSTFSLNDVIQSNGVVYFALPALRFPSFSKVLGKLVINDLKAMIDRRGNNDKAVFALFDEFSVFAGEQVLNLVNMGRGKGLHAIFGTQGLADLDRVELSFRNQILNCANTLICHRLNDQESAEAIAHWIGTRDAFTITAQLNTEKAQTGLGSVRVNKEFIVHPDTIKQGLRTGEAFYVTKVGQFRWEKVRVKF